MSYFIGKNPGSLNNGGSDKFVFDPESMTIKVNLPFLIEDGLPFYVGENGNAELTFVEGKPFLRQVIEY